MLIIRQVARCLVGVELVVRKGINMANILVSVIGNDVHAVANKVIVKLLERMATRYGISVWRLSPKKLLMQ